jgi:PKD repeat protein
VIDLGDTVYFTDTSTYNGTAIAAWAWDFGDGTTGSGATTSHAFNTPGAFTVTLTITDGCGYSDSVVVPDAVTIGQFHIYLPIVVKN